MEFAFEVCDRSIIENESEYYEYPGTLQKKNYKSFYKTYTNIIINLDEVKKLFND